MDRPGFNWETAYRFLCLRFSQRGSWEFRASYIDPENHMLTSLGKVKQEKPQPFNCPAPLEQVDQHSDYNVSYTIYREGRKVGGIDFEVTRKKAWQPPLLLVPLGALEKHFVRSPMQLEEKTSSVSSELTTKFTKFKITQHVFPKPLKKLVKKVLKKSALTSSQKPPNAKQAIHLSIIQPPTWWLGLLIDALRP